MCRACASAQGRRNQQGNGRRRLVGRRSHVSTWNGIGRQVFLFRFPFASLTRLTRRCYCKPGAAYPTFWHSSDPPPYLLDRTDHWTTPTIFLHKPIWNFGWETNFLKFKSWNAWSSQLPLKKRDHPKFVDGATAAVEPAARRDKNSKPGPGHSPSQSQQLRTWGGTTPSSRSHHHSHSGMFLWSTMTRARRAGRSPTRQWRSHIDA